MKIKFIGITLVLVIYLSMLTACQVNRGQTASMPVGKAYAEGKEIYFTHTEASDAEIASTLTNMMKSPVLLVPSLAKMPDNALANVYVFANGLKGKGPLGFQGDVFDSPPGSAGYTPLRRLNVVTWSESGKVRELTSAADVLASEQSGEVTITQPGVVINMPFVVWDGGKR
jgi:hypothetical protein